MRPAMLALSRIGAGRQHGELRSGAPADLQSLGRALASLRAPSGPAQGRARRSVMSMVAGPRDRWKGGASHARIHVPPGHAIYQGTVIKAHRDRVRFSPGRKGAAGDAAHRLGFLTPSGDKRPRPEGRLAEALGRRCARLAMRCIAATGAPSRKPRQAVSMGLYHCSLVFQASPGSFQQLRTSTA